MSRYKRFLSKEVLAKLERDFDIKIIYNKMNECDGASVAGEDIFISMYSDKIIEILCIFHEIGHIELNRMNKKQNMKYTPCTMFTESVAWEYGIRYIDKYKELLEYIPDFGYDSKEFRFIRTCLKSWQDSEYNEL